MRLIVNRVLFDYFLLAGLGMTLGQYNISPCPTVFQYQQDGKGWYGLITGSSSSYGNEIKTVIYMTYEGVSKSGDVSNLIRLTSDEELINVAKHGGQIRYRVNLNTWPQPRLTKIEFNGRVACEFQHEDGQFGVTMVRREHTLYPNGDTTKPTAAPRPYPGHNHKPQFSPTSQKPSRPNQEQFLPAKQSARPMPAPQQQTSLPVAHQPSFDCGVHERTTNDWRKEGQTLPGQWPWLVALYHSTAEGIVFQCSASLLGTRFIVTAAHCLYNLTAKAQVDMKNVVILVGARDISLKIDKPDNVRTLSAMYVHEEYDTVTNVNNIALLVLNQPVINSKSVKPICLWEGEDDQDDLVKEKHLATVVGWGETGKGGLLQDPQRIHVSVVSDTECRGADSFYHDYITDKSLCGANKENTGPCNGFRGSGLYIEQNGRWSLRGIVSTYLKNHLGSISCNPTSYVIYTDVAKYRDWIRNAKCSWAQLL